MAALDQLKRNLSDLVNDPRGYLEMVADRMNNSVMGRQGTINHQGAGYRQLTDAERQQQIQNAALDNIGGGGLGIIKAKGGNWLTGSVEQALKGLRSSEAVQFGAPLTRAEAMNRWIEGPLTKYVKRDMATEGDPVRKLADQDILHFAPDWVPVGDLSRGQAAGITGGKLGQRLGKTRLAQDWEDLTDQGIDQMRAGEVTGNGPIAQANQWAKKLEYDSPVYGLEKDIPEQWGFTHLTDELRNALNPESGLPRNLLLTPEQMQQMGMEKAVRHVDAINKWRAAQQVEANAKLAGDHPAVHKVREYNENNPKGLRWVEITQPEVKLEEGWKVAPQGGSGLFEVVDDIGRQRSVGATEQEAIGLLNRKERQQLLADQLKYEGDTMGHCVGGYCDDVASGRSRIFSLRDAKGEPHVTIETQPNVRGLRSYLQQFEHPEKPGRLEPDALGITDTLHDYVQANRRGNGDYDEFALETLKKLGHPLPPASIVQIKGKANRRPNDEYLPFVQDFVKNHPEGGQWGTVGDLGNTGLRQLGNAFNEMERAKLKTLGHDISPTGYATEAEIQALHDAFNSASGEEIPLHMRGFADGGLINKPQVWEPVEGDGVTGFLLR